MCVRIDAPWDTSITVFTITPQLTTMISQDRVNVHSSQSATSSNEFSTPDKPQ